MMTNEVTPEKAAAALLEKWNDVVVEHGSVCVLIKPENDIDTTFKKMKKILKAIGYNGSYGTRKVYESRNTQ